MFNGEKQISKEDSDAVKESYDLLEKFLDGNKWMAGDSVTLADFSLIPSVSSLNLVVPIETDKYPKVKAWLALAKETLPRFQEINEEALKDMKSYFSR